MGTARGGMALQALARNKAVVKNTYVTDALSEVLGTFIVLLFAVGAGCQSTILSPLVGDAGAYWFMGLLGGVLGLMIAVVVTVGASGAHLNPAVTLACAINGDLSWAKVPLFIASQFLGGYLGAGTGYGLYSNALYDARPLCRGNLTNCQYLAGVFAPMPKRDLGIALADQIVSTGVLALVIFTVIDKRNKIKVPLSAFGPLFALTVTGINCAFGYNGGGVLNPARDLAARFMAITVGFDAKAVFLFAPDTDLEEHYWVAPLFGPMLGGIFGVLIYNFVIGAHLQDENPEPEPYVQNRFAVRTQSQPDYTQQQSQPDYRQPPPQPDYRQQQSQPDYRQQPPQPPQKPFSPIQQQSIPQYRGNGGGGYV